MTFTICPKCGNDTSVLLSGVCRECFFQNFALAQLPQVIQARICASCGARFTRGRWTDEDNIGTIVLKTIEDNLSIHEAAEDVEVCINPRQLTPHMYKVEVEVVAAIQGERVTSDLSSEIRIIRESCEMCSRMSGGYFEGILQIRATERIPTENEIETCLRIVDMTIDRMRAKGDRLAFITDTIRSKEGLDLYIGSVNSGRHICKAIIEELGGTFSESPSLFGQKDGKEVYRITFSMRLPRFTPGDIITIGNRKIVVKHMEKKLTGTDLTDSSRFIATEDDIALAKHVGHVRDAVNAVLVSEEEHELMILDPFTFRTVNIKKPAGFSLMEDEEIPVIRIEDALFLLPPEWRKSDT
ncbi:60S ribosomal export protein NMD3 [Methanomethylovorans sp.]|uniref:60S ribosomal export protein NMD3 n=1 Tax=Methanomethylovorans sp. TaxID=2758717 RepID=UPI00351C7A9C